MKWPIIYCIMIFVTGCTSESVKEQDLPSYVLGRKLAAIGKSDEALKEFSKVIQSFPAAKNVYLEIGQIYLFSRNDPVYAIYYFRQFLERNQDKRNESIVYELIDAAKRKFMQQIFGTNELFSSQRNFLSLLRHLREENDALRARIEELTKHM